MTIDKTGFVPKFRIPLLKPSKVTAQEVLVVSIDKRDIGYYLRCLEKCLQTRSNLIYSMGCIVEAWMTPWQRARMIRICFKRKAAHSPTVHHLVSMGAGIRWAENSSFVKSKPHLPLPCSIILAILFFRDTFVSCEVRAVLALHLFYTSHPYPALLVPRLDLSDFVESVECNAGCRMTLSSFRLSSKDPTW